MSRRFPRFQLLPCAALVVGALACTGGGGGGSTPATADFSVQATPGSIQIPAGGSGFITLTLSRLNGFSGAVTITGAGLPAGVVANGAVPVGATTLQLPVIVAAGVAPSVYSALSLRAQSGALSHEAPFSLTVAQALAPGHLRDDLVQAAGGRQTGGAFENQPIVREGMPALAVKDASGGIQVRHGFHPSGVPTDH